MTFKKYDVLAVILADVIFIATCFLKKEILFLQITLVTQTIFALTIFAISKREAKGRIPKRNIVYVVPSLGAVVVLGILLLFAVPVDQGVSAWKSVQELSVSLLFDVAALLGFMMVLLGIVGRLFIKGRVRW